MNCIDPRRGLLVVFIVVPAMFAAGCGGGGASKQEAEQVAIDYAAAMSKLDVHRACQLEFTNRHGGPYRRMTEADKKRECEETHLSDHPLQPGAPVPPEHDQERYLFGLAPAFVQSVEISGDSATVVVHKPHTDERRHVRLTEEDGRWLVYEVPIGELISP